MSPGKAKLDSRTAQAHAEVRRVNSSRRISLRLSACEQSALIVRLAHRVRLALAAIWAKRLDFVALVFENEVWVRQVRAPRPDGPSGGGGYRRVCEDDGHSFPALGIDNIGILQAHTHSMRAVMLP